MKVIVTFGYNLEGTANDYSQHTGYEQYVSQKLQGPPHL